jgi:hypothetical protein
MNQIWDGPSVFFCSIFIHLLLFACSAVGMNSKLEVFVYCKQIKSIIAKSVGSWL